MKQVTREIAWMIIIAMGGVLISAAVIFVHSQNEEIHWHPHSHEDTAIEAQNETT